VAAITAAQIISRFNTVVRNAAPAFSAAAKYYGNFDWAPWHWKLGPQAEVTHTDSDIINPPGAPPGGVAITAATVFNLLHAFAMELTRVRQGQSIHLTNGGPLASGYAYTALHPREALYFQIPFQPIPGEPITSARLETFLSALSAQVNVRRSDNTFNFEVLSCHSNCHSACHGARGRR
jgi:hypothetical protein